MLERSARIGWARHPSEEDGNQNANYEILGLIVEVVSGTPYDVYVAQHIHEPLGMAHSHVLAADAFADGASEGFYRWFGLRTSPFRTAYPRAIGPAGVSFSSAGDMARWAAFHLGHVRASGVLQPESLARLHERAVQYDERHWYGMGWVIRPLWEELDAPPESGPITEPVPDLVEHGGAWATAHTYIGIVPQRDWGVVMLANVNDRTMSTRYYYTELGLLNILSGNDPHEPRLFEPPLIRFGKQILVALFVLQLGAIAWTVWVLRRARGRTGDWRAVLAGTGLALVVDVTAIHLLLVVGPEWFGAGIETLVDQAPDVGPFIVFVLLLAVVWAPVRTVALIIAAGRRRIGGRRADGPATA
jgi:CubicO group peptidase (beta-lactamase class C family)